MQPHVIKVLSQQQPPQLLEQFFQRCKGLVEMSRSTMKDYYDSWDLCDATYRGERTFDATDRAALKRNEPAKVFVPLTHSQVQTFVSFATMVLTQRDYVFELSGSGIEDEKPAKLAQAVVQRDLEHNKFEGVLLPQWLTDVARWGLGVLKTDWVRETIPVAKQVPDPKWQPDPNLPAPPAPPMIQQWVPQTKYLGNRISVISPYRWFPDTRLPITRYRDGEFCADENEYSWGELEKLESAGTVAGLTHVPRIQDSSFTDRRTYIVGLNKSTNYDPTVKSNDPARYILITEVQVRLNPAQTFIDDGVALDPTLDTEVVYLVWIANDGRIIRLEDSGYDHNEFLYDAAQFFSDQTRTLNAGLAELIAPMQDIMDWLLNSHVTNVRKVISNQLFVDPRYVDMQDLKDRNPVVRMKSTTDGLGIDSYVKQLQVVDATAGHITDMQVVSDLAKESTGLQENLLGQYAQGRRSAREASNVNANAAARVQLPIRGLWDGALLPMGRKMISNIQQGLDMPQLVAVVGLQNVVSDPGAVQAFLPVDRTMLVGSYDFLVFDGTLPSQRMAIAASIAAAGETLMKDPRAIFLLNKDPKLLFEYWLELQGVRNVQRFDLTPDRIREIVLMAQLTGNAGGSQVPPGQNGGNGQNGPRQPAQVPQRGGGQGATNGGRPSPAGARPVSR